MLTTFGLTRLCVCVWLFRLIFHSTIAHRNCENVALVLERNILSKSVWSDRWNQHANSLRTKVDEDENATILEQKWFFGKDQNQNRTKYFWKSTTIHWKLNLLWQYNVFKLLVLWIMSPRSQVHISVRSRGTVASKNLRSYFRVLNSCSLFLFHQHHYSHTHTLCANV